MPPVTRAIILAAGKGGRLYPETADKPKALLEIGSESILEFQVRMLKALGVAQITVVTGYKAERVHEKMGNAVQYVHNALYAETNSLYSLFTAFKAECDSCLILNADVLFDPAMVRTLLHHPAPDALLVDFRPGLGDEEMKVITRNGIVAEISKQIDPARAEGENVGIIKVSGDGAKDMFGVAEACAQKGEWNLWTPHGVAALIGRRDFVAISTDGFPWIEIDYPYDLEQARAEVYPRITERVNATFEVPDSRRDSAATSPV